MQVREAYSKWWKMKQSQSEFLSKMFPTNRSTPAVSVSQVEHSMECPVISFSLLLQGSGAQKMKEQRPQVYVMKTADISCEQ